jgi:hypothetical protein
LFIRPLETKKWIKAVFLLKGAYFGVGDWERVTGIFQINIDTFLTA